MYLADLLAGDSEIGTNFYLALVRFKEQIEHAWNEIEVGALKSHLYNVTMYTTNVSIM